MPGLISAHTHVSTGLDRGLLDNDTLDGWLLYLSSSGVSFSHRDTYLVAALGAAELLRNGCTALMDHTPVNPLDMPAQGGAVARACADIGIRATISPLYMDLPYQDSLPLHLTVHDEDDRRALELSPPASRHEIIDNATELIEQWSDRHPLIRIGLGPSGPQRCTDGLLEDTLELSTRIGVPIHTHVCETKGQAIKGYHEYGSSMIRHLDELGLLSPRASLAHVVWIERADIELLASTGAVAVHNPISNMKLGSGIAPVLDMREAGVTLALGADGVGCGDNLDMFEVVKAAALLHRSYHPPSRWITGEEALSICLQGGAATLQQDIGRLSTGAKADLVVLDGAPYFRMTDDGYFLRQLVYANSNRRIETVMVNGEVVVSDGELVTADLSQLRLEAQELVDRMEQHMTSRREAYARAKPILNRIEESVGGAALAGGS